MEVCGVLVNMSGKLRMLSHRVCLFVALVTNASDEEKKRNLLEYLEKSFLEFKNVYNSILNGNDDLGLPKLSSERVADLLEKQPTSYKDVINSFIAQVDEIFIIGREGKVISEDTIISLSLFTANELLAALNAITSAFEEDISALADTKNQQITETLEYIYEVGSKIRMISFNAKIEAARVGDVGRGFSIIAGEIQNLSLQTQEAANSLKEIVGECKP